MDDVLIGALWHAAHSDATQARRFRRMEAGNTALEGRGSSEDVASPGKAADDWEHALVFALSRLDSHAALSGELRDAFREHKSYADTLKARLDDGGRVIPEHTRSSLESEILRLRAVLVDLTLSAAPPGAAPDS